MLPDREWKPNNQREARTRTSLGNNDNQDGDTPSWMFKDESNRGKTKKRETQRRSQPRSRKMITVLLKILKSKRIPQKESVLPDQCWQGLRRMIKSSH